MNRNFLIYTVILSVLVKFGLGINCYVDQCSDTGTIGKKCLDSEEKLPFDSMEHCEASSVCIKQTSRKSKMGNIELPAITTRTCGSRDYCQQVQQISQSCDYCDKHLCNNGLSLSPPVAILTTYLLKCIFF